MFHNDARTQIGIDFILKYFETILLHKKYDDNRKIKSKLSKFIEIDIKLTKEEMC